MLERLFILTLILTLETISVQVSFKDEMETFHMITCVTMFSIEISVMII